ncbi:hypothetical protein H5410_045832 [Solanum commersonii]|uniref:Uncharacterized protein n=1 Tax=Solanum commersonii TaxID=4109 RepID=A0A9J5XDW5_SOLCO|nr:hypothetical protein H5410_045832 [Solanum commersonii]
MVEVSNDKDESETESENIICAVEKRRKKTLGKQKPKTRRASVRKEVDWKKGENKEQGRKRVKETTKRKREVSPDTEEIFAESEFKSEKGPGSRDKKRKIITKPGMNNLVDSVEIQGWTHLFIDLIPVLHKNQARAFYYNAEFTEDGSLNTQVGDRIFHLNEERLGEILGVPP